MSRPTTTTGTVAAFPDAPLPAKAAHCGRGGRATPEERRRKHVVELLTASALVLVPWTVLLGLTLPSDYRVHAWRATWVGFDVLLLTALTTTAVLAKRRHRAVVMPALASAVLLVCDAWFDVSLSLGTPAVWGSLAFAVCAELPMAAFLFHRTHALLRRQWAPRQPVDGDARQATEATTGRL
ncbi:hypothetical protein [Streptomyces sp. 142MFCol3.1]|uniref:hypothetical protein n=1 Tax=Streptomyces sp. 142MFCol3.1 TaxID=1172179 RepID=UPI0018F8B2A2|nr:hypothetical protein [Streptomyces sp. 142MFCol3.1]